MSSKVSVTVFSLILFLSAWIVAAYLTDDIEVLPQPWDLWSVLLREWSSGDLPFHMMMTLFRVIVAFIFAMVLALIIGGIMGAYPEIDRLLDPWLVVFLNLPALVMIVLCYLWIGLNEWAAILAVVLNKVPNAAVIIREGARSMDPAYHDMAKVYHMPRYQQLRHIIMPQMAPFIAGAARSGIALIWKIVLVVEFLGRSNGVGFQIHMFFQLFDVASVLVYSMSFIMVMLCIEWLFVQPLETRTNRWRVT